MLCLAALLLSLPILGSLKSAKGGAEKAFPQLQYQDKY